MIKLRRTCNCRQNYVSVNSVRTFAKDFKERLFDTIDIIITFLPFNSFRYISKFVNFSHNMYMLILLGSECIFKNVPFRK